MFNGIVNVDLMTMRKDLAIPPSLAYATVINARTRVYNMSIEVEERMSYRNIKYQW